MEDLDALTYAVNGLAMKVHRETGPGLDEIIYHQRLSEQLDGAGIAHQFKPVGKLIHRNFLADQFEPDLMIPPLLCPECKAIRGEFSGDHFRQLICYQKFWRIRLGLLMNFGRQSLALRRIVYDEQPLQPLNATQGISFSGSEDTELKVHLCEAVLRLYSSYGLGYRATTYRGLMFAELAAEKLPFVMDPIIDLPFRDGVRKTKLDCFVVDGRGAVMVLALQNEVTAADRAALQTFQKYLDLAWGIAVNFGKKQLQIRFVTRPRQR